MTLEFPKVNLELGHDFGSIAARSSLTLTTRVAFPVTINIVWLIYYFSNLYAARFEGASGLVKEFGCFVELE